MTLETAHLKNAENMNILAFDTTLDKTYIALQKVANGVKTLDGRVIKTDEKNYHSAYLISAIKDILQKNDLKLQELGLIAVNNGPGSFTGIRVGVTVAKTLSKELGVNVLGVSSLDILQKAYTSSLCEEPAQNPETETTPDVVTDARKESFYFKENSKEGLNVCCGGQNADAQGDILLVPYSEIKNKITKNLVVCDSSSYSKLLEYLKDTNIELINFEEKDTNLAFSLLEIAKETLETLENKGAPQNPENPDSLENPETLLPWHTLNPRYIQPPPIHKK